MIETFEEYLEKRYLPLEERFLEKLAEHFGREFYGVQSLCLVGFREALLEAVREQEKTGVLCSYMSLSVLGISILERRLVLQIDFYDKDWVYGKPFARSRMEAKTLFVDWDEFCESALDDRYFVRSRVRCPMIRPLFSGTMEKAVYLFTCFAKYFMTELSKLPEFLALKKADAMYVTSGVYLDWQERIYGIVPEVDLDHLEKDIDLRFREFRKEIYRGKEYQGLDLGKARFLDCLFERMEFSKGSLQDAYFKDCRFHRVYFSEEKLAGATFENCSFWECIFDHVTAEAEGEKYFGEAVFEHCYFQKLTLRECDLSHTVLENSSADMVRIDSSELGGSDWEHLEGGKADD